MAGIDYKEYARQMRENCIKDYNGNIICSAELWEQLASMIEKLGTSSLKTNRKMIESLSDDEWAEAIDRDGFTSLQDKICLELCPSQDCEPQGLQRVHKEMATKSS